MNTKRQTIWLVSMLGLMVVLSAYYLFSGNPNQGNMAAQGKVSQTQTKAAGSASNGGASATGAKGAQASAGQAKSGSATDQQILDQVQAQEVSGSDYFMTTQMNQNDAYQKAYDKLMAITQDKSQSTAAVEKAYNQMNALETTATKINDLESKLMQNFKNAVISQDNNKYVVAVEADKLAKSQAVSIADMVMQELNLSPSQVVVKYLQ